MPSAVGVQNWFIATGATPRNASASGGTTPGNGVVLIVRCSTNTNTIAATLDGVAFTGEMGSNTGIGETGGTSFGHVYYWLNITGGAGAMSVTWTGGGTVHWLALELPASMMASFIASARGSGAAGTAFMSPNVAAGPSREVLVLGLFTSSGVPTYTAGIQPNGGVGYVLEAANVSTGLQIESQTLTESKLIAADLTASVSVNWSAFVAAFAYAAQPVPAVADRAVNPIPMRPGPGGFTVGAIPMAWLGATPAPPTPPPPPPPSGNPGDGWGKWSWWGRALRWSRWEKPSS